jgi:hypothetical protein
MWCNGRLSKSPKRELASSQDQKIETSLNVWNSNKAEMEDIKFVIVPQRRSLSVGEGEGGWGLLRVSR